MHAFGQHSHRGRRNDDIQAGNGLAHVDAHGCTGAVSTGGVDKVFGSGNVAGAAGAIISGGGQRHIYTAIGWIGAHEQPAAGRPGCIHTGQHDGAKGAPVAGGILAVYVDRVVATAQAS